MEQTVEFVYDEEGNLTTIIRSNGNRTSFSEKISIFPKFERRRVMPLLWRIIYCTIIIFFGFKIFMWSLKDYQQQSFLGNLLDALLDFFTDFSPFSAIGGLLVGLFLIIMGVWVLISGG